MGFLVAPTAEVCVLIPQDRTETRQCSLVIVTLRFPSGNMQGSFRLSGAHCVIASSYLLSRESPKLCSISSLQSCWPEISLPLGSLDLACLAWHHLSWLLFSSVSSVQTCVFLLNWLYESVNFNSCWKRFLRITCRMFYVTFTFTSAILL